MKLAVVGCTGLVGSVILKVLNDFSLPISELILVASSKSVGKSIRFNNKEIIIESIEDALAKKPPIAIFSAGGELSRKWASTFAENGTTVIDNSSAWRMEPNIPLIVPEINGSTLNKSDKIIANPNCSTIQMVLALKEIHQRFKIKRLVISTYQSVTGTGVAAVEQMMNERKGIETEMVYPHKIDQNCFPHGGEFLEDGYTTEEVKLENETKKIFNDNSIKVTATVVRIPVIGGHSEAVNVETIKPFEMADIQLALKETKGVIVKENNAEFDYPMPINVHEKNEVFVGRIRRDKTVENGINLWIVADNLRKGAATNAVQIAEYLIDNKLVY
ncbi:MAG: aspartate-semialdehyde dehydrogenase [Crocinitomicaceae bacterium]|nr:aspartate-semialdehyde dehydrogenase [Crocinitomicaceae bacterium]|tara:strand:- start:2116 stop:3108 length:993 start_codon:yes stop_codon:yes gene_type:complete